MSPYFHDFFSLYKHEKVNSKDAIMITAVGSWIRFRLRQSSRKRLAHSSGPAWRCQKFEHGLIVGTQHFPQVTRHGISPKEVVVQ